MISDKWNIANVPPRGDIDVAEFAFALFEIARIEKVRLGKPQEFLDNFALYKGKKNSLQLTGRKGYSPQGNKSKTPVNLYFANIERTVSNITARNPTGEVVDLDGKQDDAENILSTELKKWWKDTDQQQLTKASAKQMEIYGVTPEKPSWDKLARRPAIAVIDPFSFLPAPGNWDDDEISTKCPYVCYAYVEFVAEMEHFYEATQISPDEAYELMGRVREEVKVRTTQSIGNYVDPMTVKSPDVSTSSDKKIERCLVIEVWIRDKRTRTEKQEEPLLDAMGQPVLGEDGQPQIKETSIETPVYRDGIRKITITRTKNPSVSGGWMVLDDCDNPNINPALPTEQAINTYPWGKLPAYFSNSYKDGVSLWGFSAAEQVGDLLEKIGLIVTKLVAYVIGIMSPPLIVQQHCGITREMIEGSIQKAGRLILMPSIPNARIEFMKIPDLPTTFFQVLELIVKFFDRIYQIEDADRGKGPKGVIAASAIVALQERNQVLMQAKTTAIDNLVENRSRWAIGLWQNHGTAQDQVTVAGEAMPFIGVQYAGRKFSYVVEAGSTTPRTSLQVQELAMGLIKEGVIDRQAVLQTLNFPNWKEIIARMADGALDQALNVLVQAGMPQEMAVQIKQQLMQLQQVEEQKKVSRNGGSPTPAKPAQGATA